ncbi:TPA: DUF4238 domain-containing protein [Aeromonas dhakensis]|nr:DUF4238 domain-containing protein [Aeromonas dhakensis]
MGRQAGHHYIPASYLAGFTMDNNKSAQFCVVPVDGKKTYKTSPTNVCKSRDYYSLPGLADSLSIEKFYATDIEPKIKLTLDFMENNKAIPSKDDLTGLFLLGATLWLRNPKRRNLLTENLLYIENFIDDGLSDGIKVTNRHKLMATKGNIISAELTSLKIAINSFSNKHFQLFISEPSQKFITSDNPCYISHRDMMKGIYLGLDTPENEICFPINKNMAVIARNEPCKQSTFKADEKFVSLLNTKIAGTAQRYFFTEEDSVLLLDKDMKTYEHLFKPSESWHQK